MNILYISISGNTRAFVKRLITYAEEQHQLSAENPLIKAKEISENTPFTVESTPFFTFVPTYLEGGNGVDNGDKEILTEVMREYLEYENNYEKCLGVVGSGNKNFNYQYCLTAKQYSQAFGCPFLADYELRGTSADLQRVYQILKNNFLS
ncbi:class Ib ribonucleoside-diphosphate reductase assembly flavoprotein NrdI [Enterococcus dongliensis]|uniref:class Ib ribonucleoside-diphosphate reductase assembly flavoprotein NrdI n=1 Tax=Enterococcus dongliensis TaxID=2559925 RepID=UPI00288F9A5B|nr:class Ib ribonucleoside-diphosphate reductase assembly flavoprotein NrdI [Enterococcus dongliensis]MDT2639299.1 class Ib ribonucleoside-diphosphate reductase assembly flavoprotein NrdI [Enterococcus dongliensis]MDT2674527.1 class Ib ribonucleoside-diphosphate reductase assembly flavoprotein NrdI [Enterococcus dongliensis]